MRRDMERIGAVIECIQASAPDCFDDVVIWSVWQVIGAHFPHNAPFAAVKPFSRIDLKDIKERARALTVGEHGRMSKTWPVMATLIAMELKKGNETP